MARSEVILPYSYYFDPDSGRPIALGKIYVGIPDLDPHIEANRQTIFLIEEDGNEVTILPAAQPIPTNAGGGAEYNGSPVKIQTEGSYSIAVDDSQDVQKYYSASNFYDAEDENDIFGASLRFEADPASLVNEYVIVSALSPKQTEYIDRQVVIFPVGFVNTTSSTLNIRGESGLLGAKQYLRRTGAQVDADFFNTDRDYIAYYDETANGGAGAFIDIDYGLYSTNQGFPVWSSGVNFPNIPTYVIGSDGLVYVNTVANGPDYGGAVNPVGDVTGTWMLATFKPLLPLQIEDIYPENYTTTTVDFPTGTIADSTETLNLRNTALSTRDITQVWSEAGPGGRASAIALGPNQTWFCFIIGKPDGSAVSFGFDTDRNATNLLADAAGLGYTLYRRRKYLLTDGANNIILMKWRGNIGLYFSPIQDISIANTPTAPTLFSMSRIPAGLTVRLGIQGVCNYDQISHEGVRFSCPDDPVVPPVLDVNTQLIAETDSAPTPGNRNNFFDDVVSDASQQVRIEATSANIQTFASLYWVEDLDTF